MGTGPPLWPWRWRGESLYTDSASHQGQSLPQQSGASLPILPGSPLPLTRFADSTGCALHTSSRVARPRGLPYRTGRRVPLQ